MVNTCHLLFLLPADAVYLRAVHGLVGRMCGGLSQIKQQSQYLGTSQFILQYLEICPRRLSIGSFMCDRICSTPAGLPMALVFEELVYCYMKKIARIVRAPLRPSVVGAHVDAAQEREDEARRASGAAQSSDPDALAARTIRREEKKRKIEDQLVTATMTWAKKSTALLKQKHIIPTMSPESLANATTVDHLESLEREGPAGQLIRDRCRVFIDLRDRGYVVTAGSRLGADFLAYPGDPDMYHAQLTVHVLPRGKPLLPIYLAGAARVTHSVRKHLLLAYCEGGDGPPGSPNDATCKYLSISPPAGFGELAVPETKQNVDFGGDRDE